MKLIKIGKNATSFNSLVHVATLGPPTRCNHMEFATTKVYTSVFQPVCPDTLGCRRQLLGVSRLHENPIYKNKFINGC